MTPAEAEALVRATLREVAPDVDIGTLPPDEDLRDAAGLDSLDFLQMVEVLSARCGKRIEEDDYPRLRTLRGTVRFLAGSGE